MMKKMILIGLTPENIESSVCDLSFIMQQLLNKPKLLIRRSHSAGWDLQERALKLLELKRYSLEYADNTEVLFPENSIPVIFLPSNITFSKKIEDIMYPSYPAVSVSNPLFRHFDGGLIEMDLKSDQFNHASEKFFLKFYSSHLRLTSRSFSFNLGKSDVYSNLTGPSLFSMGSGERKTSVPSRAAFLRAARELENAERLSFN